MSKWNADALRALYPQGPTIEQLQEIRAAGWRIVEVDREPTEPSAVVVTAGSIRSRPEVAVRQ